MNALNLIFILVVGYVVVASALPTLDELSDQKFLIKVSEENTDDVNLLDSVDVREEDEIQTGGRFRRATCDLLSFSTKWGSLNHSACAAHCLALRKGYKGGRCVKQVCRCRK